jgi:hypothetical protein
LTDTTTSLPWTGGGDYTAADLVIGLPNVAAWLASQENPPLLGRIMNIPIPAGPRAMRVEALNENAEKLGVMPVRGPGMEIAWRDFGGVIVEVHLLDEKESPENAGKLSAFIATLSPVPAARVA